MSVDDTQVHAKGAHVYVHLILVLNYPLVHTVSLFLNLIIQCTLCFKTTKTGLQLLKHESAEMPT